MQFDLDTMTALWGAVIFSGFYHGVNPGMGWPLAVSAALMEGRHSAMARAIAALGLGHLAAMLLILLPFSMINSLLIWEAEIRIAAGVLVLAMGVYLLINRRHPRILSRIPPTRLALWSFIAATAHGAGLMLVPIYLGLRQIETAAPDIAIDLLRQDFVSAIIVALMHTAAMTFAGGVLAVAIYRIFGLKFISRTWFNLDIVWALSLILVGGFGIYFALGGGHQH